MGNNAQTATSVIIPPTTTGPPGSGHGGACGGIFAAAAGFSNAAVRFHAPIPLNAELTVERLDDAASVTDGSRTIASIVPLIGILRVGQFGRLPRADVIAAEARFLDHHDGDHMAPTCFACGNRRTDALGLDLRPGAVADTGLFATRWRPQLDGAVPAWLLWAALDCPSGIPALAKVERDEAVVTGELCVEIRNDVPGDGDYQIIGRRTGRDGRKFTTESALIDERGRSLAVATATWIVVPNARLRMREELAAAV